MKGQRIVLVYQSGTNNNVDQVNALLERGWSVVSVTPMGGAAVSNGAMHSADTSYHAFAALVVLERDGSEE